eukprot:4853790-Prymnesium_polylepis.2
MMNEGRGGLSARAALTGRPAPAAAACRAGGRHATWLFGSHGALARPQLWPAPSRRAYTLCSTRPCAHLTNAIRFKIRYTELLTFYTTNTSASGECRVASGVSHSLGLCSLGALCGSDLCVCIKPVHVDR